MHQSHCLNIVAAGPAICLCLFSPVGSITRFTDFTVMVTIQKCLPFFLRVVLHTCTRGPIEATESAKFELRAPARFYARAAT